MEQNDGQRRRDAADGFWAKVLIDVDGCWEWQAYRHDGYGQFNFGGRPVIAHRYAYEQMVGPIPAGLVLDHLCENPPCVRPSHLEPVTIAENLRRGPRLRGQMARTHCPQGHEYAGRNLIVKKNGRNCRACAVAGVRRWRAARKVEANG